MPEIILILSVFIMYFRTIWHESIIDDNLVPRGKDKNPFMYFINHLLAIKYRNLKFAKVQRLAVHSINCILIYYAFGQNVVSFYAALLYAVNPLNINGVAWLNGIGYSLCGTAALLMQLNHTGMIVPYLSTLFLHLVSFTAPVFIALTDFSLLNCVYAVFCILCYVAIAKEFKWQIPLYKVQKNATVTSRWNEVKAERFKTIDFRKLVFVTRTYSFYFWKGIFPLNLGLYPDFGYGYGVIKQETERLERIDFKFMFDFFTFVLNIWLITAFYGTPISTGLIWWNVFMLPFCNMIILQQTIADRYTYVPNIGLSLAVASVLLPVSREIYFLYLGMLATKLWLFLPAYKDMGALIDHNLYDYPRSEAGWNWKGVLENVNGRFFSSIHYWAKGLYFEPNSFRLNYNIYHALMKLGLKDQAKVYFDRAQNGLPEEIIKAHEKELDKQEESFKKSMNITPKSRQSFRFS